MQLIKILFIGLLTIVPLDTYLSAQTLTDQEYKVINDLFGCMRDSEKYRAYTILAPDSVYNLLIETNPDSIVSILGSLNLEKLQKIMKNFEFNVGIFDTLDDYSFELKKSKLERGMQIKKSPKKGIILSRPLISGNYAIIYAKSPCVNYVEQYIFAKKILGEWVYYGDFLISAAFVDPMIPENWKWKNFWRTINIFRTRYCD